MAQKQGPRSRTTLKSPGYERARVVVYECPVCGPASRFSMAEAAYVEGWCVGPPNRKHKPKNFVQVDAIAGTPGPVPQTRRCEGCLKVFPKSQGRYPRLCDECKEAA